MTFGKGQGIREQECFVPTEALLEPSTTQAGLDCWTSALGPQKSLGLLVLMRAPGTTQIPPVWHLGDNLLLDQL